jgi:peroxiredoxin
MWLKALKYFSKKLEVIKEIIQAFPDIDFVVCEALVREVVKYDKEEDNPYIRSNSAFLKRYN